MNFVETLREMGDRLDEMAIQGARDSRTLVRNIGWVSAGVTAVALGLVIGRELRQRYKFQHRTPYDFYAHSGDQNGVEFGVGI